MTQKPIRKVYKNEERMPYMNSRIDLSFPEIQSKAVIKFNHKIDTNQLKQELEKANEYMNTINKKHIIKVQNHPRNNNEYKESYFDSSMVPRDYTRFTYISKDNNFYYNGKDI